MPRVGADSKIQVAGAGCAARFRPTAHGAGSPAALRCVSRPRDWLHLAPHRWQLPSYSQSNFYRFWCGYAQRLCVLSGVVWQGRPNASFKTHWWHNLLRVRRVMASHVCFSWLCAQKPWTTKTARQLFACGRQRLGRLPNWNGMKKKTMKRMSSCLADELLELDRLLCIRV